MLSIFPELLFLSPLAATLIRVALALLFAYSAWSHVERSETASRILGLAEAAVAISLALGIWTQPGALLGAIIAAVWFFQSTTRIVAVSTILLALVMSVSLLLTGPGAFAFDLPL